jgi:hypothetical protein
LQVGNYPWSGYFVVPDPARQLGGVERYAQTTGNLAQYMGGMMLSSHAFKPKDALENLLLSTAIDVA